jgi:fumarate hydratase subunit alpha
MSVKDLYSVVTEVCENLYIRALKGVPEDVVAALKNSMENETSKIGKRMLEILIENIRTAKENDMIVCQDTGSPVYYVTIGDMEVNIPKLFNAIKKGVEQATIKYNLRPNMVHPITRKNTGTNTGKFAPIIHIDADEKLGKAIRITAMPKGSGSENLGQLAMLVPADGLKGVKKFILESLVKASTKGCPPYIVGIGIGSTFDGVAFLAKKALFRPISERCDDEVGRELEEELLREINELGIGPQGVGGRFTAVAVNVEIGETHISSLPVAVNIQCWKGQIATAIVSSDLNVKYII